MNEWFIRAMNPDNWFEIPQMLQDQEAEGWHFHSMAGNGTSLLLLFCRLRKEEEGEDAKVG